MTKKDYINYRLDRAYESFEDAKLLAENDRWNTAINRLYYGILHFIEEKYKMVLPNVGTHKFSKDFSKSFSYKEKLDNLEQERVNSDYFHHRSICLESAKGWKDDIIKDIIQELDPGSPSALEVLCNELKKD